MSTDTITAAGPFCPVPRTRLGDYLREIRCDAMVLADKLDRADDLEPAITRAQLQEWIRLSAWIADCLDDAIGSYGGEVLDGPRPVREERRAEADPGGVSAYDDALAAAYQRLAASDGVRAAITRAFEDPRCVRAVEGFAGKNGHKVLDDNAAFVALLAVVPKHLKAALLGGELTRYERLRCMNDVLRLRQQERAE